MSVKSNRIFFLSIIVFSLSISSFLLTNNISNNIIGSKSVSTVDYNDVAKPTTSGLMTNIVMDGVINAAEWINASHVEQFYLDLDNS